VTCAPVRQPGISFSSISSKEGFSSKLAAGVMVGVGVGLSTTVGVIPGKVA
jgi:hypothetical protein